MSPPIHEPAVGAPPAILVIDDEAQIRRLLEISLRVQGYAVREAATGAAGLARLADDAPDLVVLDLGLPDRDGFDILRDIRQRSAVPVLVLTVRSREADKVAALDAGANDYVTKPFGMQELLARVRALLRPKPTPGHAPDAFDDGRLHVDRARREVRVDGVAVALTRKEYALLDVLLDHEGRIVTQRQLLRTLWGPTHESDTHYLRILVAKLRQKLGDDAASPTWLSTEPGIGLRFLGRAERDAR